MRGISSAIVASIEANLERARMLAERTETLMAEQAVTTARLEGRLARVKAALVGYRELMGEAHAEA